MHRPILIRPTGAPHGGELTVLSAAEVGRLYSPAEQARLMIGLPVDRDGTTHVDLLAFHDRHATPDLRGSTLLRRLRRLAQFTLRLRGTVMA